MISPCSISVRLAGIADKRGKDVKCRKHAFPPDVVDVPVSLVQTLEQLGQVINHCVSHGFPQTWSHHLTVCRTCLPLPGSLGLKRPFLRAK